MNLIVIFAGVLAAKFASDYVLARLKRVARTATTRKTSSKANS
jgi:hypothetical protein